MKLLKNLCVVALMAGAGCANVTPVDSELAPEIDVAEQALATVGDFDIQTMRWGSGHDSVTGRSAGTVCVADIPAPAPIDGSAGQITTFNLELVESSESLYHKLGLGLSAKVNAMMGSGSAKARWTSERTFNSYSLFALVRTKVVNPTNHIDVTNLKPYYENLYATNLPEFRKRCGDQFVAGLTTGGEFVSLIQIETSSQEDQRTLSLKIKAKSASGNFSASADLEEMLKEVRKDHLLSVTSFQFGGVGDDAAPPFELADMFARARDLPRLVQAGNARGLDATFHTYDTLEVPIVDEFDVEQQREYVGMIVSLYDDNRHRADDREFVLRHPEQFVDFDENQVRADRDALTAHNVSLLGLASKCSKSLRDCDPAANPVASLSVRALPRRIQVAEQGANPVLTGALARIQASVDAGTSIMQKVAALGGLVGCGPNSASRVRDIENELAFMDGGIEDARAALEVVRSYATGAEDGAEPLARAEQLFASLAPMRQTVEATLARVSPLPAQPHVLWRAGRDAGCGVELFASARSAACGVESYHTGVGGPCGATVSASYTKVSAARCSRAPDAPACDAGDTDLGQNDRLDNAMRCPGGEPGYRNVRRCERRTPNTCAHPDFGVQSYNACRHESHGVEAYAQCRAERFGMESFLPCYVP